MPLLLLIVSMWENLEIEHYVKTGALIKLVKSIFATIRHELTIFRFVWFFVQIIQKDQ